MIHSACPMPLAPPSLKEVTKEIVDGTLTVLKACEENNVSRLVFTSHYGAITNVDELDRPEVFDESCWSDLDKESYINSIHKSKTLAEKAAFDFAKSSTFELVTLCPTLLIGPSLMCPRANNSSDFLRRMLKNEL